MAERFDPQLANRGDHPRWFVGDCCRCAVRLITRRSQARANVAGIMAVRDVMGMVRRSAPLAFLLAGLGAAGCDGSGMPGTTTDPDAGAGTDAGARLPEGFRVLDGKTGQALSAAAWFSSLAGVPVVCLGEEHDDPDHHGFQAEVVRRLGAASASSRQRQATGFEMFQRPFQPVLDAYGAGQRTEDEFLAQTEWKTRWGFEYDLYRPVVQQAIASQTSLLALNAPKELTSLVSKGGLDSLTAQQRAQLPAQIDLTNQPHRAWFARATEGAHPPSGADGFERFYSVQVVWDTSMADVSAQWIASMTPMRAQVAVIAGNGHCHDLGIPLRLQQRNVASVSVRMVRDDAVTIDEAIREGLYTYVVAIQRGFYASL